MNKFKKIIDQPMLTNILYTGFITLVIMILLHHLYNYLQSNLTIPKVNELVTQKEHKEEFKKEPHKDELKEYMNQFKKK
jgi:hypothetical protein